MKKYFFWGSYFLLVLLVCHLGYQNLRHKRLGTPSVPFKRSHQQCHSSGDFRYCEHETPETDSSVYLYVLHGKDQSEQFWQKGEFYAGLLQNYLQKTGQKIPKVISISFGPLWLITPKMTDERTGLLETFRNQVFPNIEREIGVPQQRFLMGASMGGINALTLVINMPEFFKRVAVMCPPIYEISPFSSTSEILDFMVQSGAKPQQMSTALGVGRVLFKNDEEWKRFSPIDVIKAKATLKGLPPLYLSCGEWDEFGNFATVANFAEIATSKGAQVSWWPNSGDHCAVDVRSLADFLKL